MINYPDPFLHPLAYWQLTMKDVTLSYSQKQQMLATVGMGVDKPPRAGKMNNIEIGQTWRLKSDGTQVHVTGLGGSGKTVLYVWCYDGRFSQGCSGLSNWYDLFEFAGDDNAGI